jgi:putative transposase
MTLEVDFCIDALSRALKNNFCAIFNTDQGSQFTSDEFTKLLLDNKIKISMDGRGRALDNIFVERLWRTVKYECVYLNEFQNFLDAKEQLKNYFNFYNHERPHQSLNYKMPAQVYRSN